MVTGEFQSHRGGKQSFWARLLMNSLCSITIISSFATCPFTVSPALATPNETDNAQILTCDTAYFQAQNFSTFATYAPTRLVSHIYKFFASQRWMDVALACAHRTSEGVVKSSITLYESNKEPILATLLTADSNSEETYLQHNGTHPTYLRAQTLQQLALAEDKLRFAYETLAARSTSQDELMSLAHSAAQFSESYATAASRSKNYRDPRKRIYATDNLNDIHSDVDDPATEIFMPTKASLELDVALESLSALHDNRATQSVNSSHISIRNSDIYSAIQRIRTHLLSAYEAGAPALPELYLHE
ncbi:hypothetical protein [Alloscardovia venturai]